MKLTKEQERELEHQYREHLKKRKHKEIDIDRRDIGGFLMLVGGIVLLLGLNAGVIIGGALIGVGYYIALKYKNRKEFGGILMGAGGVILLSGLNVKVIIGGALIGVGYYLAYKY